MYVIDAHRIKLAVMNEKVRAAQRCKNKQPVHDNANDVVLSRIKNETKPKTTQNRGSERGYPMGPWAAQEGVPHGPVGEK